MFGIPDPPAVCNVHTNLTMRRTNAPAGDTTQLSTTDMYEFPPGQPGEKSRRGQVNNPKPPSANWYRKTTTVHSLGFYLSTCSHQVGGNQSTLSHFLLHDLIVFKSVSTESLFIHCVSCVICGRSADQFP